LKTWFLQTSFTNIASKRTVCDASNLLTCILPFLMAENIPLQGMEWSGVPGTPDAGAALASLARQG